MGPNNAKHLRATRGNQATLSAAQGTVYKKQNKPNKTTPNHPQDANLKRHPGKCTQSLRARTCSTCWSRAMQKVPLAEGTSGGWGPWAGTTGTRDPVCVWRGKWGPEGGSPERSLLLHPSGSSVLPSAREAFLVKPTQRASPALPSLVRSSTNLFIHLANMY